MARIEAPDPTYKGFVGPVEFVDGVAETDNLAVIQYCQGAGYRVSGETLNPRSEPETPDPREVTEHVVGTRLRDAAVNPHPEDFLPPTNAGEANPHGPEVVAPGLHAVPPGPIVPGEVGDPQRQQDRETEAAARTLAGTEPVPAVAADLGDQGDRPDPPAGNASAEDWRTYAVQVCGADPDQVADMKRGDLIERYGPKSE